MKLFSLFVLFSMTAFQVHSKEICDADTKDIDGINIFNWSIYSAETQTCTDYIKFVNKAVDTDWGFSSNGKIINTRREGDKPTQVLSLYQIIPTMIKEGKSPTKILKNSNPTVVSYNFFQGLSFEFNSNGKCIQVHGCNVDDQKKIVNCPDRLLITYETVVVKKDLKIIKANISDGKSSCFIKEDLTLLNTEREVLAKIKSNKDCSNLVLPKINSSPVVFEPFKTKAKTPLEIEAEKKAKAAKNKPTDIKKPEQTATTSNQVKGYFVPPGIKNLQKRTGGVK
ncbi:MAG: hypothetical protein ACXVCP_04845 [Bdellovibrio sp.]